MQIIGAKITGFSRMPAALSVPMTTPGIQYSAHFAYERTLD
jgi:hypothetical protein